MTTANQFKLAVPAATLVVSVVCTFVDARKAKNDARKLSEAGEIFIQANELLMNECTKLNDKLAKFIERENYLIELLNKHEVPCTEFDLIVINDLTQ